MRRQACLIAVVLLTGCPNVVCGCVEVASVHGVVTLDDGPAAGWLVRLDLTVGSACSRCQFPPTEADGSYRVSTEGPTGFCDSAWSVFVRPPESLAGLVTPSSASSEIQCGDNERDFAFQSVGASR
jgi:hypothetical protein